MIDDDIELRTLSVTDLGTPIINKLAEFLSIGFAPDSEELWQKRFKFWWMSNPYLNDNESIGWILYSQDTNEIKGFIGKIPLLFQYGNNKLNACAGTSWYVSDDVRGAQSTRLFMRFNKEKNVNLYLDTTPSQPVQKMLPEIGFKRLTEEPVINYLGITSYKLCFKLASNIFNRRANNTRGLMSCLYFILKTLSRIFTNILPLNNKPLSNIIMMDNINNKLCYVNTAEDFIKCLKYHNKQDTIEISKDKQTINWILFSQEIQELSNRKVIQIYSDNNEYCGYYVYDIKEDLSSNQKYIVVREIDIINYNKKIITLIKDNLRSSAINNDCCFYMISSQIIHNDNLNKIISRIFKLKRKGKSNYYYKLKHDDKLTTNNNINKIYRASGLDPDAGFI